jgi:phosphoribosylpyrophosphate synthetase
MSGNGNSSERSSGKRDLWAVAAKAARQGFFEEQQRRKEEEVYRRRYCVFAAEPMKEMARSMEAAYPDRFCFYNVNWDKFPDGTDNITVEGFYPKNTVSGEHVLFLASFHNNDVTLSQFSVLIMLLQSFIESLTIVLPFYPVGTNERVDREGTVATANTYSILMSNLPSVGKPIRLMIYDIHALQERFYFHGSTIPSLHTSVPLLYPKLRAANITCVVFPDDGAAKRFKPLFKDFDIVVCGKVRDGDKRIVRIQDGEPTGKHVVIVDDLVQTGGTLFECAVALSKHGASSVSAFVAHGVFPNDCWKNFCRGGSKSTFAKFWLTNSIPSTACKLPTDDCFEVLDLMPQIVTDLDFRN